MIGYYINKMTNDSQILASFPDFLLFVRRGFGNKAIAVSHERCFILFSK